MSGNSVFAVQICVKFVITIHLDNFFCHEIDVIWKSQKSHHVMIGLLFSQINLRNRNVID